MMAATNMARHKRRYLLGGGQWPWGHNVQTNESTNEQTKDKEQKEDEYDS